MLPVLEVNPHSDGVWPDLDPAKIRHTTGPIFVAGLAAGMKSGAPSVAIRISLPDGTTVLAETSLSLFLTAADALRAAHGDPRR